MYSPPVPFREGQSSPELQGLLTRKQAAKYLKVSVRTLHKWAQEHANRPRFRKYANAAYYTKEDLDKFVQEELERSDSAKQEAAKQCVECAFGQPCPHDLLKL